MKHANKGDEEENNAGITKIPVFLHTKENMGLDSKTPETAYAAKPTKNPLRRLYAWVLHWAHTPYGIWALVLTAFTESSFFPIPPDTLLIPLSLSRPKKALWYATLCSIFSVLGGILGYAIGLWLMDGIGMKVLELYGATSKFDQIAELYAQYNAIAVGIAGFTPIPYKIFTIAAGACKINFFIFVLASAVSRSARFFLVAILLMFFGEKVKTFIDKYFNLLTIVLTVLLIGGFIIVRYALS